MNKTIWYCHHYAGAPSLGMAYRPYYLAKEFSNNGFNCFNIAASYHHFKKQHANENMLLKLEDVDDVKYIWLNTPSYSNNGFKRLQNILQYSYKLRQHGNDIAQITAKPHCIIVSSPHPFHIISAAKLAKQYQAKLIFEVRDLWPMSQIELLNMPKAHPLVITLGLLEKYAYKNASWIVSLLPNAKEYMESKGLNPLKFRYIPNGISVDSTSQVKALPYNIDKFIGDLRAQQKFIIGYAGAHGVPNALEQLLHACKYLQKQQSNIHIICIGNGQQKLSLQSMAKQFNLDNISFFNSVSKPQISHFYQQVDALFIGWLNRTIYQYGISPNKLFEYMLAAKPIIHATNTPIDPVNLAQCGFSVAAEQPQVLSQAMLQLSNLPSAEQQQMGQNGYNYVLEHHNYAKLAEQYCELI